MRWAKHVARTETWEIGGLSAINHMGSDDLETLKYVDW
jgi:hypothetical protein